MTEKSSESQSISSQPKSVPKEIGLFSDGIVGAADPIDSSRIVPASRPLTLERREALRQFQDVLERMAGTIHEPIFTQREEIEMGGESQREFVALLETLATIRFHKVQKYGESRYEPESARYNLALQYGDLERKMIRLKNMIFGETSLTDPELADDLIETMADLANYGAMMLQVAYRLRLKDML